MFGRAQVVTGVAMLGARRLAASSPTARTSASRSSCAVSSCSRCSPAPSGSCTTSGSRRCGAVGWSPRCAPSSRPRPSTGGGCRRCATSWAVRLHRRGQHLRVLRPPAVPAPALRDPHAYQVAGLVAAIVAGAQIVGGFAAPLIRACSTGGPVRCSRRVRSSRHADPHRGDPQLLGRAGLIVVWGLLYAAALPIRQSYLNGLIPSQQRATVLSLDSMMSSLGGVGAQPALGRVADVWGYGPSYVVGAALSRCPCRSSGSPAGSTPPATSPPPPPAVS